MMTGGEGEGGGGSKGRVLFQCDGALTNTLSLQCGRYHRQTGANWRTNRRLVVGLRNNTRRGRQQYTTIAVGCCVAIVEVIGGVAGHDVARCGVVVVVVIVVGGCGWTVTHFALSGPCQWARAAGAYATLTRAGGAYHRWRNYTKRDTATAAVAASSYSRRRQREGRCCGDRQRTGRRGPTARCR